MSNMESPLNKATAMIVDVIGSCPNEMLNWEPPKGCPDLCGSENKVQAQHCWTLYFLGTEESRTELLEEIRDLARTSLAPMAYNMPEAEWAQYRLSKIARMADKGVKDEQ